MNEREDDEEMDSEKTNRRSAVRVGAAVAALTLLLLLAMILAACLEQSTPQSPPTDVMPAPKVTGGHGGVDRRTGDDNDPETMSFGLCPICFEEVLSPETFVECVYCCEFTPVTGREFDCRICGMKLSADLFSDSDRWVYHSLSICESLIWYPLFDSYNSDDNLNTEEAAMMTIIEINGEFDRNGVFHTFPWYTYQSLPSALTASISGEYAVHVYDGKGERLSVTRFDAKDNFRFIAPGSPTTASSTAIPVRLVVRFNEQAARIAILKGDTEIYSRNVSNNPPEVRFTGLVENQSISNKTTITWEAAGADGEELFFRLWYCTGKKEYYLLAADITGRSFAADLSDHPGSENGYFHIYATDGVRTAEAKSPVISKPFKPPVIITEQKTIPKFKITEEIYFPTEIVDAQEGRLSGNNVVWTLDGEQFGATSVLQSWPYRLTPGAYTFTCIATNSAGLSAQKEFTFEVVDDESDLPDDWSRQEIIHALKKGYIVPTGRIDSPVTRGQYADLMYMLFYYLNPEGLPDHDKNLVKDCGEYNYSEFLMAYMRVMEAPDGLFEPHKSLTQREALRIIYLTHMLAENPGLDLRDVTYSETEAEALLQSKGIFEKDKNPYQPEVRLSKKLALVWISRVDKWLLR